jgi:DNA (cytosine-5)-methyltransferase 1
MGNQAEYLTISSASQVLGVSPNTLRHWGATGKIQEYRHPLNNYRLFKQQDLEKLADRISRPKASSPKLIRRAAK